MLSSQEQMEIIKGALAKGYKGPIYELIEQAIIQKQQQSQQSQQQTSQVGTPALGGDMEQKKPPTSTERNIIKPGEYKSGGFKYDEGGEKEEEIDLNLNTNITATDNPLNLNLNRFNRNVRDSDFKNALTIGGATFLGSSGLRSINTAVKQNKGKKSVYDQYIEDQGGKSFVDRCSTGDCPNTPYYDPDQKWFYNAAGRAEDMWTNQGYHTGSASAGTSNDWSAYQAVVQGRKDGTIKSPTEMRKTYWDNIKTGVKDGLITGGSSYLLNKALDNTRWGRKLQKNIGMDINLGIYRKDGGFKYDKGGEKEDDNTYEDSYNLYDSDVNNEEEGHESTSYNDYVKNIKLYGENIANQIYEKDGKVTLPTNVIKSDPTLGFDPYTGSFATIDKLNKKYNVGIEGKSSLPENYDFNTYDPSGAWLDNAPGVVDQIDFTIDKPTNIKGSLNSGSSLDNIDSEWSLEQQKLMQTPDTFKESGVWSNANRMSFGQEFNSGKRIVNTSEGTTYKPSYRFGDDVRNDKVFYADKDGNPVGTHYTDGTPYTQRVLDWSGGRTDQNLAMTDDGSKLQEKSEFADKAFYTTLATAGTLGGGGTAAKAGYNYVVKPVLGLMGTNLIAGVGGTSTADALAAYGMYNFTQTAPENVKNMIENPSWENAGNLGWNALELGGGAFTSMNILKNFKNTKNASTSFKSIRGNEDDIIRYNTATNRPVTSNTTTGPAAGPATNNAYVPSTSSVTNPNAVITSPKDVSVSLGTKYKHSLTQKAIDDAWEFKIKNFNSAENQRRLSLLPEEQRNNIIYTHNQMVANKNAPTINYGIADEVNLKSSTLGQSGEFNSSKIGERTFASYQNDGRFLGNYEPLPRYSEININNLKLNLNSKIDNSKSYYNQVRNIAGHELDHSTNMPVWGSATSNPSSQGNFGLNIFGGNNQLGAISQTGVIDEATVGAGKTQQYFGDFNSKKGMFDRVDATSGGNILDRVKNLLYVGDDGFKQKHINRMINDTKKFADDPRYDNYLQYFAAPNEVSAKMNGLKNQMGFGATTHGNISVKEGTKIYNSLKVDDPHFYSIFKDSKAFTNMFNKLPFGAVVPVAIGSMPNNNETNTPNTQKTGGYRSKYKL